jgi:hypothetical protein
VLFGIYLFLNSIAVPKGMSMYLIDKKYVFGGITQMTLEQKLQEFQQKYANLEQQATDGSLERHVYNQIVVCINSAQNMPPAKQCALFSNIPGMVLSGINQMPTLGNSSSLMIVPLRSGETGTVL